MRRQLFGLMAGAAIAAAAFAVPANATPYNLTFTGSDGSGTATLSGVFDVVSGQLVSGSGTLSASDHSIVSDAINLVTLSTPGVHDLGGGHLSYRFGGGTDLIGDTAFPVDDWGPVFQDISSALHIGFNIWWNGGDSYTGFLAGDNGIYQSYAGTLTVEPARSDVPEPASIAYVLGGLGFLGAGVARRNRNKKALAA